MQLNFGSVAIFTPNFAWMFIDASHIFYRILVTPTLKLAMPTEDGINRYLHHYTIRVITKNRHQPFYLVTVFT